MQPQRWHEGSFRSFGYRWSQPTLGKGYPHERFLPGRSCTSRSASHCESPKACPPS
ncbi:unnamed protein product [Protopolystoma xenopodis]|uniref:Uncharacterized protein n=1 Tax=Protopolystoma xenopodis TaxID=117903 RepID=A0A448X3Z4_9PLAT|nr:unnamed protein product [Protopolystoma xenopodis]